MLWLLGVLLSWVLCAASFNSVIQSHTTWLRLAIIFDLVWLLIIGNYLDGFSWMDITRATISGVTLCMIIGSLWAVVLAWIKLVKLGYRAKFLSNTHLGTTTPLYLMVVLLSLTAILEEVLFRGALVHLAIDDGLSELGAVALIAVGFSLMHTDLRDKRKLIDIGSTSVVLSCAYWQGGLIASTSVHVAYNIAACWINSNMVKVLASRVSEHG